MEPQKTIDMVPQMAWLRKFDAIASSHVSTHGSVNGALEYSTDPVPHAADTCQDVQVSSAKLFEFHIARAVLMTQAVLSLNYSEGIVDIIQEEVLAKMEENQVRIEEILGELVGNFIRYYTLLTKNQSKIVARAAQREVNKWPIITGVVSNRSFGGHEADARD